MTDTNAPQTTTDKEPSNASIPATNPFRDSAASPPAAATTTTPLAQEQERAPVNADPRIAALCAMFPDYDDLILQSVLESVGGDQDRAIDTLLGMSDPEYKGEPQTGPTAPPLSQTELDEQLARRLMIEEQEQHQAAWQAQQDTRVRPQPQFLPPRPTSGQGQQQGQGQGQGAGGDTMAEIQQQLGKFAETGKKTFGNLFSKVKAKIQEMDQPKTGQPSGTQPTWGGASSGYDPALYEQNVYQGQQQPSQSQPQISYNTRPRQQQTQQPAYYDPNERTTYPINAAAAPSSSPPITLGALPQAQANPPMQGYDTTPEPVRNTSPPSTPAAAGAPITRTPPPTDTPRPPATGLGSPSAPIDGGKLGLLPKRPVSLLRSQSPPAAPHAPGLETQYSQQSQDDSDDLEYAENPFDEPKARK